ncbi:hypothetical protein Tco_1054531 [Tanacetum coccineum]|uniref:Uncharacterized protein n=1 Tax=Tanacetum coccineum TaxID=301880 RepID=A0ABQ5GY21_9ASTR
METEAIDNQANLVNYDNENENKIDDLGYQSEEYIKVAHEDDENNHSNGYAKRGITRLCKFHMEYGKPDGVKLSVTFNTLNRISEKHRALFLSFLGDMVREHISLQILSWKKVGPEARNKLWDEITRYFDVDSVAKYLTILKAEKRNKYEEPKKEPCRSSSTDAMTLVLGVPWKIHPIIAIAYEEGEHSSWMYQNDAASRMEMQKGTFPKDCYKSVQSDKSQVECKHYLTDEEVTVAQQFWDQ